MSRDTELLQELRAALGGWVDVIHRATRAEVGMQDAEQGEFLLRAVWKVPEGTQVFARLFSKEFVFGPTYGSTQGCRIQKRPCDYAKDFMREVLAQRGVL